MTGYIVQNGTLRVRDNTIALESKGGLVLTIR